MPLFICWRLQQLHLEKYFCAQRKTISASARFSMNCITQAQLWTLSFTFVFKKNFVWVANTCFWNVFAAIPLSTHKCILSTILFTLKEIFKNVWSFHSSYFLIMENLIVFLNCRKWGAERLYIRALSYCFCIVHYWSSLFGNLLCTWRYFFALFLFQR